MLSRDEIKSMRKELSELKNTKFKENSKLPLGVGFIDGRLNMRIDELNKKLKLDPFCEDDIVQVKTDGRSGTVTEKNGGTDSEPHVGYKVEFPDGSWEVFEKDEIEREEE